MEEAVVWCDSIIVVKSRCVVRDGTCEFLCHRRDHGNKGNVLYRSPHLSINIICMQRNSRAPPHKHNSLILNQCIVLTVSVWECYEVLVVIHHCSAKPTRALARSGHACMVATGNEVVHLPNFASFIL
jgi:hypothetical protein